MYILSLQGQEGEGAYAVDDDDGDKALYIFEQEDDAVRYVGLLAADDYPELAVVEVDPEVAIKTCEAYNYKYVVISADEMVIPPLKKDDKL
tara:strand:+ start:12697 stop:12969 length:273 start_codon:yes stop_codon:yes gene_type:complete